MPGTIIGQSGGVTPVINASLAGAIAAARAAGPVYGMRHGVRGLIAGEIVPLDRLSEAEIARLAATPGAYLGSCRYAPTDAEIETLLDRLREHDIDRLLYIGGNDSAATTARIATAAQRRRQELAAIGVPKTIDNDLPCMDHTPGYPTAAAYVALSALLLWLDTRAMRREEPLRVIEVKGRYSGWLAAACAQFVPAGQLIVLPPEQSVTPDRVVALAERALARHGCALIAVAEHATGPGGEALGLHASGHADAFGHRDSAAPGAWLRQFLERETGRRCRLDVLGALQKTALLPANTLDREEAFAAGAAAARLALAGTGGLCVTIEREAEERYTACYGSAPLAAIAGAERRLPAELLDADGQPTEDFRRWLAPLVAEAEALARGLLPAL